MKHIDLGGKPDRGVSRSKVEEKETECDSSILCIYMKLSKNIF